MHYQLQNFHLFIRCIIQTKDIKLRSSVTDQILAENQHKFHGLKVDQLA